jgi:hypothetical protein
VNRDEPKHAAELNLERLGIEEIEERLEASPIVPPDAVDADCCARYNCDFRPIVPREDIPGDVI